jgi:hypothetical protein
MPLKGRVPEACWDKALAPAMLRASIEIEEELVLDVLLDDLTKSCSALNAFHTQGHASPTALVACARRG